MARAPSKILSVAEKKQAEAGLKQAIKLVDTGVKASETEVATATKALAAAKKQADATSAARPPSASTCSCERSTHPAAGLTASRTNPME